MMMPSEHRSVIPALPVVPVATTRPLPGAHLTQERVHRVLEAVRQTMAGSDRHSRVRWTDRLSDLGLTSLRLIGLIVELEEEFRLSEQALMVIGRGCTVGRLVQLCLQTTTGYDEPLTIH